MKNLSKINGIILSTIVIILLFISNFINSETSFIGEKLISYIDSLPGSYALIYSMSVPINEDNYNYFSSNIYNKDCLIPYIQLFLYVRTPEKRLMESYSNMYDLSISKNMLRYINVCNNENNIYYIPLVNAAQIDENYVIFVEESSTIIDFINPLAGTDYFPELKNFIRNNYMTKANELRFPSNMDLIYDHVFVMPDNSCLCPPIQKINISNDGKIINTISITSTEYTLKNGNKSIFPKNMIKSWGDDYKYKSYYEVIYFDILDNNINDELFKLDIPNDAEITDNRLGITYTKNSNNYNKTEIIYPTKFSYFGISFEQVKAMIDQKINEDRHQNIKYIK
jgi:hypothetical protein